MLKCCKCNKDLFQVKDNKVKLRTNIIIFEKSNNNEFDTAIIKCPNCKADNKVPLFLDKEDISLKHIIFDE